MNLSTALHEFETRAALQRLWLLLILCLMASNVLLGIALVSADRTHRETLVPPEIRKSFWVEDAHVSASYLEQMGLFVLMNAMNVTPHSAEYQMRQILRYTTPSYHGVLEKHLLAQAKRLSRDNVSTAVAVTGVTVDEARQSVRFDTLLRTMLADKTVAETPRRFEVVFGMTQGQIRLHQLRELDEKGQPVSADSDAHSG